MVSLSLRILLAANKREGLLCIYGSVIFIYDFDFSMGKSQNNKLKVSPLATRDESKSTYQIIYFGIIY